MRTGNLPANMKKARVIQIIPCKAGRRPVASVPGSPVTSHRRQPGQGSGGSVTRWDGNEGPSQPCTGQAGSL